VPADVTGNIPAGTLLKRRYRVLRKAAQGGMGAVYEATDVNGTQGNRWAIKEISPAALPAGERTQAVMDFRREAQLLASLHHPNLVLVEETFEELGKHFLVMEFVPGDSLEKKLDQLSGRPMGEREALYYGIQVAQVLRYLHEQKPQIVFRDVKPANIMVMPNYQVKLIDFGIARKYKVGQRKDTVSMGTAAYAPFEQFGKGQTDGRSDIYSLAATLFHLLTGRPPTPATTPTSLRDLNPQVTPDTEQLIIKAMARDMDQRPQDALEMERELRQCYGIPFKEPEPLPGSSVVAAAPSPIPAPVVQAAPVAAKPPVVINAPQPPPAVISAPVPPVVTVPAAPSVSTPGQVPICPNCGYRNKAGARFCGICGGGLAGRPSARLQVMGPRGVLWERRIAPNENPFVIGRRSLSRQIFPHIDLTYSDPSAYVSRRHAQVVADGQGYSLEDLGSENGTFLNDKRIRANDPLLLHNGDLIQVGKVRMQFVSG